MRRQLWETVTDVLDAIIAAEDERVGLAIQSVTLDLPLVLRAARGPHGFLFTADLPQSLWPSGLTEPVQRISIRLVRTAVGQEIQADHP